MHFPSTKNSPMLTLPCLKLDILATATLGGQRSLHIADITSCCTPPPRAASVPGPQEHLPCTPEDADLHSEAGPPRALVAHTGPCAPLLGLVTVTHPRVPVPSLRTAPPCRRVLSPRCVGLSGPRPQGRWRVWVLSASRPSILGTWHSAWQSINVSLVNDRMNE